MESSDSVSLLDRDRERGTRHRLSPIRRTVLLAGLTAWVLAVHGYHPFAEDGGVYAAGIEKLLRPSLFPTFTAFTTEHLRFSLFAPALAALVRASHRSLPATLLAIYLASVFATLAAGWSVISRLTDKVPAQIGSVVLLSSAITIPVAGTSLMLVDQYLTARSLTTPLCLFSLAFTLDFLQARTRAGRERSVMLIALCYLAAASVHPLMAGYGLAATLVLLAASLRNVHRRYQAVALLGALALLVAAVLQSFSPPDSATDAWVRMTRYYWFPFRWQWYEQAGLIGPLVVLALFARASPPTAAAVARAAWIYGTIGALTAVLFCRAHNASYAVARLQPLRSFSSVYMWMLLLLGAWLGERWMRKHAWRWIALLLGLGGLMFFVERSTFPGSSHLELPGTPARNLWVQSFEWARDHTPENALFALDAHYIGEDGEDAQCFRAIAQRSALPDYSKDGGEASITPTLTAAWIAGQSAQTGLENDTDAQRRAALLRLGVSWLVLRADATTAFECPYRNARTKVCRLPQD